MIVQPIDKINTLSIQRQAELTAAEFKNRLVLGVDGGGTKTKALLAECSNSQEPLVIGSGETGPSNLRAVGEAVAFSNIKSAVEKAFENANVPLSPVANAVLAVAGSGTDTARSSITNFCRLELQADRFEIAHDGQAALYAGTNHGIGIVMIAGTGSVAYGQNSTGETAIAGGWGYRLGDEGSALWIGQNAMRAVARAADGRGQETRLTKRLLEVFETTHPRNLVTVLETVHDARAALASIATDVSQAAVAGDQIAQSIISQAISHWIEHIDVVADKLFPGSAFNLVLAGGVLKGNKQARSELESRLSAQSKPVESIVLVDEPAEGCVKLASERLRIS